MADNLCTTCGGALKSGTATDLLDAVGGAMLVVTDIPANVCSQCGETYLSGDTAMKLEEIAASAAAGAVKSTASVPKVSFADVLTTAGR